MLLVLLLFLWCWCCYSRISWKFQLDVILRLPSDKVQPELPDWSLVNIPWLVKAKENNNKKSKNPMAYGRLLDYDSLLDYSSFNVDHSWTFPWRKTKGNNDKHRTYWPTEYHWSTIVYLTTIPYDTTAVASTLITHKHPPRGDDINGRRKPMREVLLLSAPATCSNRCLLQLLSFASFSLRAPSTFYSRCCWCWWYCCCCLLSLGYDRQQGEWLLSRLLLWLVALLTFAHHGQWQSIKSIAAEI